MKILKKFEEEEKKRRMKIRVDIVDSISEMKRKNSFHFSFEEEDANTDDETNKDDQMK